FQYSLDDLLTSALFPGGTQKLRFCSKNAYLALLLGVKMGDYLCFRVYPRNKIAKWQNIYPSSRQEFREVQSVEKFWGCCRAKSAKFFAQRSSGVDAKQCQLSSI